MALTGAANCLVAAIFVGLATRIGRPIGPGLVIIHQLNLDKWNSARG